MFVNLSQSCFSSEFFLYNETTIYDTKRTHQTTLLTQWTICFSAMKTNKRFINLSQKCFVPRHQWNAGTVWRHNNVGMKINILTYRQDQALIWLLEMMYCIT